MTKLQRYLMHVLISVVAVFLADMFSRMGHSAISWFLAGAIAGLSMQLATVTSEKRRTGKTILATLLSGVVAGSVAFFVYSA